MKERRRQLHSLAKSMRQVCLHEQINKSHSVLWETRNGNNVWTGYTDNFIRVESESAYDLNLENKISNIKNTDIAPEASHCIAKLILEAD